ncbi:GNAT family N-acetyltransferase [Streptomyces sp. SID3343]|uniref:GNAT family N-acetyltransferase n=1 Tax=Streptomyces sp. SID3343 TaxID=2690260 RepID=UPI001370C58A|nr:GNAT family N-acetyltransferase [Streptomyces sp. SID3343]MYW03018.1 GNAT family N-acetyltransferase [Streptomyces sp. SID3343]
MNDGDERWTEGEFALRPWEAGDAEVVVGAFAAPEMSRQASREILSAADAHLWLSDRERDRQAGTGYSWAVVGRNAAVLGCVAVTAVDRRHDTGWVSYWTVEAARGRGVAAAGVRAAARWAFAELKLYRLELGHRLDNPASCRVAERAGFVVEGVQRGKLRYGDVRHDVELHARLATDA